MNILDIVSIVRETDSIFFDESLRKDVTQKGASDYVTRADTEISKYLHKRLKEEYPEIGFISEEENTDIQPECDYWILDPIDGTTNFMHGLSMSAVSLGLYSGGEITAGVIYIPYTGEMYWAKKGEGAFLNGEKIRCSQNKKLSDCIGMLEYNAYLKEDYKAAMAHALKIFLACQDIRTFGSTAISLCYIACGKADVFLGRYIKPWDYAAGLIIIKEAGGVVSEPDKSLNITELNRHIAATNPYVYEEFLDLINK